MIKCLFVITREQSNYLRAVAAEHNTTRSALIREGITKLKYRYGELESKEIPEKSEYIPKIL